MRNLLLIGGADLFAFDPDSSACTRVEQEMGVGASAHIEDVWRFAPNIAVISCSTQHHVALATQAANRGVDLFIEKPVSHSRDGIEDLAALVRGHGLITMVGCNMRFHPGPAAVKRLLENKRIGEVIAARIQTGSYLPRWRPWQDYHESYSASPEAGGAALDCIHEIDLAQWYFGSARLLSALSIPARTIGLVTDGLVELLLQHETGAISSVHLNFVQRDYRRGCQIIGGEGTIYWDFTERRVELFGEEGQIVETILEPEGWQANQMYIDEMEHFLDAVRRRQPAVNPIAEAARTMDIAIEARRAN